MLEACDIAIESGLDIKLTFLGRPRTEREREICSYYKKKFNTQRERNEAYHKGGMYILFLF